jgi:hexosaminidase
LSQKTTKTTIQSRALVEAAIKRTQDSIFSESFVPWRLHPRESEFEPSLSGKKYIKSVSVIQLKADPASTFKPLAGEVDESYTVDISKNGEATITASTSTGVLWGLSTFQQLFYQHSIPKGSGAIYTNLAPVSIKDKPLFSHRGLNLDVARNWFAPADIKHMLDSLSFNKFNRLHLHVTDAQSWPLEIPALPKLAQKGAYAPGLTYSTQDIQDIQLYATARGIEVILEIDQPGHTSSIALGYPELIAAYNVQPDWRLYCAEPPCGTLKLNDPAVPKFITKLFNDLLPRLHPHSAYFHTGGDEIKANAYLLDETVKSNSTAVITPLLQKYIDHAHDLIRAQGLTPVVWEEMLIDWNLTLGKDVLVQTWLSDASVKESVTKGHKTVFGNYESWVC